MSQRGKRPNRSEDGAIPVKRRKVIVFTYYTVKDVGGACLYRRKISNEALWLLAGK